MAYGNDELFEDSGWGGSDQIVDDALPSAWDKFNDIKTRFGYGAAEPFRAVAQSIRNSTPKVISDVVDQADPWLYKQTGGILGYPKADYNQTLEDMERSYKKPEGFDIARAAGNVVSGIPLAVAPIPPGMKGSAVAGAFGGMMTPVYNSDIADDPLNYLREKALQAVIGGAGGAAMHGILSAVAPGIKLSDEAKLLREQGVDPTVGQAIGGWVGRTEEKAMSFPIVGDAIRSSRRNALNQFNEATINQVYNEVGNGVGPVTGRNIGRTAIDAAHNRVSEYYDDALSKVTNFSFDNDAIIKTHTMQRKLDQLPESAINEFHSIVKKLPFAPEAAKGNLQSLMNPGQKFKLMDSELGEIAARYKSSTLASERGIGEALLTYQNIARNQLAGANPEMRNMLQQANKGFAKQVRIENAANKSGVNDGVFTPGQLLNAVKSTDRSVRKNQFARGKASMQTWAQAGQKVLGDTVPNSGTVDRLMLGIATGAGLTAIHPGSLVATVLGAASYHPRFQSILIDHLQRGYKLDEAVKMASRALTQLGTRETINE